MTPMRIMNPSVRDSLRQALAALAVAQCQMNSHASEIFCADIPNGRINRYAHAHAFAHDICHARTFVAQLIDQTGAPDPVLPSSESVPPDPTERSADLDGGPRPGPSVLHRAISDEDSASA